MTNNKKILPRLIDLNYPFLKQQGINYIKQLAGKVWTDYHEHDPGMAILEVLSFAIVDLEYRTNFSIEDLLQPKASSDPEESLQQFYQADEILPCNALTANDYLKLVADVPGVRNAKILLNEGPDAIQGGYHILVDIEDRILQKKQESQVLEKVKQQLYRHRNLCEDFFSVAPLKPLYLGLHATLEVSDNLSQAACEQLIAEILFHIQSFIAPAIKFHSLRTMLVNKGKTVDEVFTGPLLEQGFIDEATLGHTCIPTQLYISELLKRVTTIKQVNSVAKFAVNLIADTQVADTQASSQTGSMLIEVPVDRVPKLAIEKSHIRLYQKGSLVAVNTNRVMQLYDELIHARLFKRPYSSKEKIAVRKGRYRNLASHYSIQNDFPLIFGVGKEGLAASAFPERKAQANQLKAYLMFFDQLFANYLAQLAHVKDLMAVNNQMSKGYFTQLPEQVPDLDKLLRTDHAPVSNQNQDKAFAIQRKYLGASMHKAKAKQGQDNLDADAAYRYYLNKILNANTDYAAQKNNMLDHLLARFSESFSDHYLHIYDAVPKDRLQKVIYDKAVFLQDYLAISRDRNKGIDLTDTQNNGWDRDQISGFERRLARSLGIKNLKRRFLHEILKNNFYLEKSFAQQSFELFLGENLQDKYDNLIILKGNFPAIKELAIRYGADQANYAVIEQADDKFGIILYVDRLKEKFIEFVSQKPVLNSYEQAQGMVKQAVGFFQTFNRESEGFHLIEHILLRTDDQLQGDQDPYSFRMTLVLPAWPARFQSETFKNLLNELVMLESPAHVFVNILWLDLVDMQTFEKAYKDWLYYKTTVKMSDPRLKQASRHLLGLIMLYSQEEI